MPVQCPSDANIWCPTIKEPLKFQHGQIPSKTAKRSVTDNLPCHQPFAKLPEGKHNIESLVKVLWVNLTLAHWLLFPSLYMKLSSTLTSFVVWLIFFLQIQQQKFNFVGWFSWQKQPLSLSYSLLISHNPGSNGPNTQDWGFRVSASKYLTPLYKYFKKWSIKPTPISYTWYQTAIRDRERDKSLFKDYRILILLIIEILFIQILTIISTVVVILLLHIVADKPPHTLPGPAACSWTKHTR